MDLSSIVFTGVFIVLGVVVFILVISFLAYKVSKKQTYKSPIQKFEPQEIIKPKPSVAAGHYYQMPVKQFQQKQFEYDVEQQTSQNYAPRVSPYQVYTN